MRQYPSPYTYAGNNPINNVDPDGQWCQPCVNVIVAVPVGLRNAYVAADQAAERGVGADNALALPAISGTAFIGTLFTAIINPLKDPVLNGITTGGVTATLVDAVEQHFTDKPYDVDQTVDAAREGAILGGLSGFSAQAAAAAGATETGVGVATAVSDVGLSLISTNKDDN